MTDVLDVKPAHVWPKMREVAESVRDNQLTAVPAGHSVSKTYGAGRIAVWFKTCFQPSTVITTAPSDNLVTEQLWREIRSAYQGGGGKDYLGGKMTTVKWDLKPSEATLKKLKPEDRADWEKNFAIGFSTSPDSASEHVTKMQGWHNKYLLVILDEAGGIILPIWKTVLSGLIINERCKVLAIGNPTDPYSKFADVCKLTKRWNVINISTHDTPNYLQDAEVVPNLAGRQHERDIIEEYGENSNEHRVRCLGKFPTFAEGTVYGPEIAKMEKDEHYGDYPWDERVPVFTVGDYGSIYTAIGFFQLIKDTLRMVDYFYDDVGVGIPAICKMFESKPYMYYKSQGHWLPPDYHPEHGSNRKSLGSGKSVLSEFGDLGFLMSICEPHSFDGGVKTVRTTLPLTRIDVRCKDFWDSFKQYKFKKNLLYSTDKKPAYSKDPQPGPSNHPADMMRYTSWIYRFQMTRGGVMVGSPLPVAVSGYQDDVWGGDVLEFGRKKDLVWT
ncbi:MAG: hypothetical protein ACYST6_19420 [Planctomycetota bacterium]|jgi:hypothetical protein